MGGEFFLVKSPWDGGAPEQGRSSGCVARVALDWKKVEERWSSVAVGQVGWCKRCLLGGVAVKMD